MASARVRADAVLNKVVTPRQASMILSLRAAAPAAGGVLDVSSPRRSSRATWGVFAELFQAPVR